VHKIISQEL